MDKTETFIKMSDCPEIQGHELVDGDYFANYDDGLGWYTAVAFDCEDPYYSLPRKEGAIWLPRQDQLQAMVDKGLWVTTLAFEYFLRSEKTYNINNYAFQFTSMEQLWLAFVMFELYHKTWHNGKWEKE